MTFTLTIWEVVTIILTAIFAWGTSRANRPIRGDWDFGLDIVLTWAAWIIAYLLALVILLLVRVWVGP